MVPSRRRALPPPRRVTVPGSRGRALGGSRSLSQVLGRNVYVTATEPRSGKSLVALGLMDMLFSIVGNVGFFRPIVPAAGVPDPEIELFRSRYQLEASYADMHALDLAEASELIAGGEQQELEKRVVNAFKALERQCEFVVCEGTDFTGAAPGLDFEFNAQLAGQLACPVLAVIRGTTPSESATAVRVAYETLARKGCEPVGVIVNRVPAGQTAAVAERVARRDDDELVFVLPENEELACPTVAEVAAALDARVLADGPGLQGREVRDTTVAAMSAEHFIEDLVDGTLVIVPGDRPDIVIASLACTLSPTFPAIAGIVLTSGYAVAPAVGRLLEDAPFAVLQVGAGTYATATAVHAVRPVITAADERKIATAIGVFEAGVDTAALRQRIALARSRSKRMTPIMFEYELIERAKAAPRRIVLPEGEDDRVLRAADILLRRRVVELTILGDERETRGRAAALGLDLAGAEVVDPLTASVRDEYAHVYHELRRHKGVTEELARDVVGDPSYFATLMVHRGAADGMVSGAAHTTGDTIRPAFEIIKVSPGSALVSSVFFMCLADRVLVYGDCAVNPQPDSEGLAEIAISSAETARSFGIDPYVAMLSYSTGSSAKGERVDAVRRGTEIARERRPDLKIEGPIQYDAAVDPGVAAAKLPESDVAGRATVFIFPDLDTGNVAYKAVQRSAQAVAVGPVLQGLRKPVNDLSRGCSVTDIINTVAITAIQAAPGGDT